ncbi:hypothetical protein ABKW28_09620 [Nocardioides sp. 31GB23]|uniref:hypothetical protein n=1 Tax=Nocardioides sp. 31GB23 TaxID=3156065 RepID=UPI0032AEDD0F
MRKSVQLLAAATTMAGLTLSAMPAQADSTIVKIKKRAHLSDSSKIAYVKATVTCSEDTTSARLTATLTQVTVGGTQTQTAQVSHFNAFECDGEEETVWIAMRRPTGGFKWEAGKARVTDFVFETADPSGHYSDVAKGRTVRLR